MTDSRTRTEAMRTGPGAQSIADRAHGCPRRIVRVVRGAATSDGAGVSLTRVIGGADLDMHDPFLLLDSFESDNPDDYIAGFPSHPHRGFETVTYMLHGRMRHRDNQGHSGIIGPGSVQWMTAGRGIVHSEMPEQEHGLMHGFQLWVNLPRANKMTQPAYREYGADEIPAEPRDDGGVIRVIAGSTDMGTSGPVAGVVTEPLLLDVTLAGNGVFEQSIAPTHNAFVYVIEGRVTADERGDNPRLSVDARTLGVFGDGDRIVLRAAEAGARCLVAAARRLDEPVARGGPFVMNTREELRQASEDYYNGRF